ncbi:MAG: hypothetical protein H7318_19420 [Oligoflexus sp.]|nr:hypothetical protein [Oligoflexus sp.]
MNHAYDELSRPVETKYLLQEKSYGESIHFDELGRVKQKIYPSGLAIGYRYDAVSQTKDILDQKLGKALWSLRDIYPSGEVKEYLLGNGVIGRKSLDEKTDRIKTEAMVAADQSLQTSRSYSYDSLGNLKTRQDDLSGVLESFSYDRLNRLETFTDPSMKTVTMVYDDLSRIKSRSDVGEYSYGKSCEGGIDSSFVPKSVGGKSLCSDGRGNIVQAGERSIRYDLTD